MQTIPPRSGRASDDPALLTAHLLLRIGFGVLAVAVPTTAAFSRRTLFVLLPFGAGLILIAGVLSHPRQGGRRLADALLSPLGLAVLFLGLWAALSLIWTPFLDAASQRLFKMAATLLLVTVAVAFLPERMRLSSLYLLPVGAALAAIMTFAIGLHGGSGISGNTETDSFTLQRALITLVIMVWPALNILVLRGRWAAAGALGVAVAAAAVAAQSPVALFALGSGALVYGGARYDVRRTTFALALASAALFLLAPVVPLAIRAVITASTGSPPDWMQPIAIWADIVVADRARLITGHGLETMLRGMAAGYLPSGTPKSFLFEIWYELGVIGAVAVAVIVGRAFWSAGRAGPGVAPFLVAALASALTLAVLDQNAAQLWWVTMLGIAVICFAGVLHCQYRTSRPLVRSAIEAPQQHSAF